MKLLKIIFAGTPEFAGIILKAILATPHQVVLVMSQPDRPSGRGLKIQASPVKEIALGHQLPILQPSSLKLDGKYPLEAVEAKELLENIDFDVMVVAAYGLILPIWVLDLAQTKSSLGCINVHASLLPRWRGAAPIHRAIWSGDQATGTCIMKMAEGLDTGPIISCEELAIDRLDTTHSLHDRLAAQGAHLLVEALNDLARGKEFELKEQALEGVNYASKIVKDEATINWHLDAKLIDRQIRALNPSPGAVTHYLGQIYKVWLSEDISGQELGSQTGQPGEIIHCDGSGIQVACGTGVIRIMELQKAGSKRLMSYLLVQSNQLNVGQIFS